MIITRPTVVGLMYTVVHRQTAGERSSGDVVVTYTISANKDYTKDCLCIIARCSIDRYSTILNVTRGCTAESRGKVWSTSKEGER